MAGQRGEECEYLRSQKTMRVRLRASWRLASPGMSPRCSPEASPPRETALWKFDHQANMQVALPKACVEKTCHLKDVVAWFWFCPSELFGGSFAHFAGNRRLLPGLSPETAMAHCFEPFEGSRRGLLRRAGWLFVAAGALTTGVTGSGCVG